MTPLSLYIHIPFCARKCNYCDFVSFGGASKNLVHYINALCTEIKAAAVGKEYIIQTIYIGGGTPSILPVAHLRKLFAALKRKFNISPNAEITIEVNPNSATPQKLAAYKTLGINRLSIGVQSFDDATLKILGRPHTAAHAISTIKEARACGFQNISIDLIHSTPHTACHCAQGSFSPSSRAHSTSFRLCEECKRRSNPESVDHQLTDILQYLTHVSLYSLIIEPNTLLFEQTARKELIVPTETESLREQIRLETILKSGGFTKYEVSNFARSKQFQCRHNKVYWQGGEYLGFGLAAHSLFENNRFSNTENLDEYLRNPIISQSLKTPRTNADEINETIMLGLRLTGGVPIDALTNLGYDILTERKTEIADFINLKLLKSPRKTIAATAKGFNVLNKIIEALTL